jgi:hypothetical protein
VAKAMSSRLVVDLHRRRLWLTEAGLALVGEAFKRHGAVGWYGPGCIRVWRVAPGHRAQLHAELKATVARATEPAGW